MAIGVAVLGILGLVGAEDHKEALRAEEEHQRWQTRPMQIEEPLAGWEWE
jgi:hypothetical protein